MNTVLNHILVILELYLDFVGVMPWLLNWQIMSQLKYHNFKILLQTTNNFTFHKISRQNRIQICENTSVFILFGNVFFVANNGSEGSQAVEGSQTILLSRLKITLKDPNSWSCWHLWELNVYYKSSASQNNKMLGWHSELYWSRLRISYFSQFSAWGKLWLITC